jgi:hypothetical protein
MFFLALFIGMSLAGAALILSVPPLFRPHERYQVWITVTLGCLSLLLAAGMLYLRLEQPRRSGPGADD